MQKVVRANMGMFDNIFRGDTPTYVTGMDFGTYRSLMAIKAEGENPQAIVPDNQLCRKGIPSLFWHPKSCDEYRNIPVELTCGDVLAYGATTGDPDGVVHSIKMRLREPFITLHRKQYKPHYIATQIMKHIVELSKQTLSSMAYDYVDLQKKVVIGVPVRFGNEQRQHIMDVAHAVNFKHVELLPEPMAAALYYAHSQKTDFKKVLVFDMGAGTFDTAFLVKNNQRTPDNEYPYISKGADGNFSAGNEFDKKMAELIICKLEKMKGNFNIAALKDDKNQDYLQLLDTAQRAKEMLSDALTTNVMVTGNDFGFASVMISRNEYEEIIAPIINEAIDLAERILKEANAWEDGELSVLMVGGGSYIPLVRKKLMERFNWLDKDRFLQKVPDQAIALGCAIFAEYPALQRKIIFGYGVEVFHNNTNVLHVTVPSNVGLPYRMVTEYETRYENQNSIVFKLYEIPNAVANDYIEDFSSDQFSNIEIVHRFGKPVPIGTTVTLFTEITEDGLMKLTVDDDGVSPDSTTIVTRNIGAEAPGKR